MRALRENLEQQYTNAPRCAPMRALRRAGVPPDIRSPRRTARARPSPGLAAWRWLPATSGTSRMPALRPSIPGRRHERRDGSLRAGQDRCPAPGRGLEPDGRFERAVRARVAGRDTGRLCSLQPVGPSDGGARSQAREHRSHQGTGPGPALRRATGRAVRVPVERRGGAVPGPRDRRARPQNCRLLVTGRPGAADRRPAAAARPDEGRDRPENRRPRLPDRMS